MSDLRYNDSELQMESKLILCIEENENETRGNSNSIDTRLFIGWSNTDNDFYLRGKRQDIGSHEFVPYSFHCESAHELYDFIKCVIDTSNTISIILYNFNNIDSYINMREYELNYEFFEEHIDRNYEIAAYDNEKINRKRIVRYLNILKTMYNWSY